VYLVLDIERFRREAIKNFIKAAREDIGREGQKEGEGHEEEQLVPFLLLDPLPPEPPCPRGHLLSLHLVIGLVLMLFCSWRFLWFAIGLLFVLLLLILC